MISRTTDSLAADLAERVFYPRRQTPMRGIGAEIEIIPVEDATGKVCPFEDTTATATLPFLRNHGRSRGWSERPGQNGVPVFHLPDGGTLTPEPGGQLEYSSPRCRSIAQLIPSIEATMASLRSAAADAGIRFLETAIDPMNPIGDVPLQLEAERYRKMTAYFDTLGPAGVRMMRQTAAIQVNLDFLEEPWLRWKVLNAAAPFAVAIFANSPIYANVATGCLSYRSETWRRLDPTRTGLLSLGEPPVREYLQFALAAPAMLMPRADGRYRRFAWWWSQGRATIGDWQRHLTTLFPEVRPKGYLETRSIDAPPPAWYAVPICFLAGLVYDHEGLHEADRLLGDPDPDLLNRSGVEGLDDPTIARVARDLFRIALDGCARFGPEFLHPRDLETTRAYFDRFTSRGRTPAHDALETHASSHNGS